jgi:hypothetical protein
MKEVALNELDANSRARPVRILFAQPLVLSAMLSDTRHAHNMPLLAHAAMLDVGDA